MRPITSWGRIGAPLHKVIELHDRTEASKLIAQHLPGIAYGQGRSYGDICLNPGGTLWRTTGLNRFINFDPLSGKLSCEPGILLRDIQQLTVPLGWTLPVTPGTQLITLGGAIANDVHGKNHHIRGTFGEHILSLRLLRTNGEILNCNRLNAQDWLHATIGGLGLTGLINHVEIQLQRIHSPWLSTETIPYGNLDEFLRIADDSEAEGWEHTVSWVDCVSGGGGRGIFLRANPANPANPPFRRTPSIKKIPFCPPISLINRISLRILNSAYFNIKKLKSGLALAHYDDFLYPLDSLADWNKVYGPHGFYQYQCVIPRRTGKDAIQSMLKEISRHNEGSFLAVLKTFGERQAVGMLSFPQAGITLALDFPNNGSQTLNLFARLDAIVSTAGGRLYAAKDARMPKTIFESGYPNLGKFLQYRDPGISSGLSRRLMGY